ncbi:DUF2513 domain-containing protein [Agrobacterium vitis]|nr:DUF2513 domain-containing protein [Agrobacterium vitis]
MHVVDATFRRYLSGNFPRYCKVRVADMKLEIDLLREVLLFVEEKAARPLNEIEQVSIPGYEDAAVAYHIILAEEAGLLVAQIDTLPDTDDDAVLHVGYSIQRLT